MLSHSRSGRVRHVSANRPRRDRLRTRAMKYIVSVNGEDHAVTLSGDGVSHEGAAAHAHLEGARPGTPIRLLTLDGKVHSVLARRQGERGRYTLWLDGYRYEVEALDERTRAI
ncbi:MAG: hypothetical protein ABIV11_05045, partial [Gemmatimonadaceae bacterium]